MTDPGRHAATSWRICRNMWAALKKLIACILLRLLLLLGAGLALLGLLVLVKLSLPVRDLFLRLVTVGVGLFLRHIKCWLQDTSLRLILLLSLMSPWSPQLLPGTSRFCLSCQLPRKHFADFLCFFCFSNS